MGKSRARNPTQNPTQNPTPNRPEPGRTIQRLRTAPCPQVLISEIKKKNQYIYSFLLGRLTFYIEKQGLSKKAGNSIRKDRGWVSLWGLGVFQEQRSKSRSKKRRGTAKKGPRASKISFVCGMWYIDTTANYSNGCDDRIERNRSISAVLMPIDPARSSFDKISSSYNSAICIMPYSWIASA